MEIKFPAILDKNIGITVIGPVIVFINWKEANKDEISNCSFELTKIYNVN